LADLCRTIREETEGCEAVLLAATELEAAPLLEALKSPRRFSVATKTMVIGHLPVGPTSNPGELGPQVVVAIGGCDKTNTAHVLTCLLQSMEEPRLVLQFGIGGALRPVEPAVGANVGDIVVVTKEIYADTGTSSPSGWISASEMGLPIAQVGGSELGNVFDLDQRMAATAVSAVEAATSTRVVAGPGVTVSRMSGTTAEGDELAARWGAIVESMEGAAAAHVCALHEVPLVEVRGISNLVVDRDRSTWRVGEAVEKAAFAAVAAARALLAGAEASLKVEGESPTDDADLSENRPLRLAFSPCPNDTHIFYAWTHGKIEDAPPVEVELLDIDTLNRKAAAGQADVIKVSMHAFAHLRDRYALLHCGGALGRGVGPLIVARKDSQLKAVAAPNRVAELSDELARSKVAIPGKLTTAALLLGLMAGGLENAVVMPFSEIMPAVVDRQARAGVIIHEGRFTYGSYGLRRLLDLGEWWEATTSLPLALGGVAVSRRLSRPLQTRIEKALRASVEFARANPSASREYVAEHSQELSSEVCQAHIDLYVNDYTLDYGPEGEQAVRQLLESASALQLVPPTDKGIFWDDDE
jgi:1,4-dihydroxy-6-naphthoate synthase